MRLTFICIFALALSACVIGGTEESRHESRQDQYNHQAYARCQETPDIDARRACEDQVAENSMRRGVIPNLPSRTKSEDH